MAITRSMHATLTLDGNPQAISSAAAIGEKRLRGLSLTHDPANTHAFVIGGTNATLTASDYGDRMPAPSSSGETAPTPPWVRDGFKDGTKRTSDYVVLGFSGEKVHILADVYVDP